MHAELDLRVELAPRHKAGLSLATPIMLASGCGGYGALPFGPASLEALGAVVTLPVGLRSRRQSNGGFVEVTGGVLLIDDPGCLSPGTMRREFERAWRAHKAPLIARLAPPAADWPSVAQALGAVSRVVAIECDLANMPADEAAGAVRDVVGAADVPVLARVTCTAAPKVVEEISAAGADAVVIGNPPRGMAWSATLGRFVTGEAHGAGLFPLALATLHSATKVVGRPLVLGCGVHTPRQAVEALLAGASAVQVGVAVLADPTLPERTLAAIREEMQNRGLSLVSELIGREAA